MKHCLKPILPLLAQFKDSRSLFASQIYDLHRSEIQRVLKTVEIGGHPASDSPKKKLRLVSWNIERGKNLEGLVRALNEHHLLQRADIVMLQEVDLGMARSGNIHVTRELAERTGFKYFYVPGFLELSKGSREEALIDGENSWSLQGQALLTRVEPLLFEPLGIPAVRDRMRDDEKCIGERRGFIFQLQVNGAKVTIASSHLDHHTTPRGRADQFVYGIERLQGVANGGPAIFAGDFNATTYDVGSKVRFFLSCAEKVVHGFEWSAYHYMRPYEKFEPMFAEAKKRGFDYESANDLATGSLPFDVTDEREYAKLTEMAPKFIADFVRRGVLKLGGRTPFKLDWFFIRDVNPLAQGAALDNGTKSPGPAVIEGLRHGGNRISDHDPILLDITV